jgi:hypothetical protein
MLIKDMPTGAILWFESVVIGVKDITLDKFYEDYKCNKINGNRFDYELDIDGLPDNILHDLIMQNQMIENELFEEVDEDYEEYDYEED